MGRLSSAILGLYVLAGALPAVAQETVTLRVGDVYPTGHYIAEALTKPFMDAVKQRLGSKVDVQYFPAEQLGKGPQLLSLTQQGVIDIGLIIPAFTPDKLPRSAVAELPGGFSDACQGTAALYNLATSGILADKEYGPNGIHILLALVLPPYQIFLRGPIDGMKSFAGQKIYSTGGAKDLTVRRLGGVPTRMTTSEIYEAISRGTIDGGLMAYGTAVAYRLPGLVKSGTANENFGSGAILYGIGLRKWRALPEDIRAALDEAGKAITAKACETIARGTEADMAKLRSAGVNLVSMPAADRPAIDRELAGVATEWGQELDSRNLDGSAVLTAFRKALQQ